MIEAAMRLSPEPLPVETEPLPADERGENDLQGVR